MPSNLATSQGTVEWNRSGTQKEEPAPESKRDQRVILGGRKGDTSQGKRRDREAAPVRARKAIFCKVYIGLPSTYLTDKWELASPYVVTIQSKGEDSS